MPPRGPRPKADAVHRNPLVHPGYEPVVNVPFTDAEPLPPRRTNNRGWPEETKRWWATVSSMPHCVLWQPSDWAFARTTALIAGEVHAGEMKWAAELRTREKIMGTTADARSALRIVYVDPTEDAQEKPLATVTYMEDLADLYGLSDNPA